MMLYLVSLEFCYGGETEHEVRVAKTMEKAREILKEWAENETRNTWIADYSEQELWNYELSEDYFDAQFGEFRTTIWITTAEIEE